MLESLLACGNLQKSDPMRNIFLMQEVVPENRTAVIRWDPTNLRRISYQGALIMTFRDRARDPSGQRAGRREAAGDAGRSDAGGAGGAAQGPPEPDREVEAPTAIPINPDLL